MTPEQMQMLQAQQTPQGWTPVRPEAGGMGGVPQQGAMPQEDPALMQPMGQAPKSPLQGPQDPMQGLGSLLRSGYDKMGGADPNDAMAALRGKLSALRG